MGLDELLTYCLAKPGAWRDDPWGDGVVIKVGTRIFVSLRPVGVPGDAAGVSVKSGADRDEADEWLTRYPHDVAPSPHVGRFGWNSLAIGGAIPDEEILAAVDASYAMIVSKLPTKDRPAPA